jgi:hypothetical protein
MKWFEKSIKIKSSNNITDKTMIPTIRIRNYGSFLFSRTGIMINVDRDIAILYPSDQETSINLLFEQCKFKVPKKTTDSLIVLVTVL